MTRHPGSGRSVRPRRIVHAFAALAVALAVPLAGATAANATPASIGFDDASFDTIESQETLSGPVDLGDSSDAVVQLRTRHRDGTVSTCTTTLFYFDTSWSCQALLDLGENRITVRVRDIDEPGGWVEAPNTLTVTRGTDDVPVITRPDSGVTRTGPFTVRGTGPVLGTVDLIVDTGFGTTNACTRSIGMAGTFSCTLDLPVSTTTYEIWASGSPLGALEGADSASIFVDVEPPAPSTRYELGPARLSVTATADPSDNVSVGIYEVTLDGEGYSYGEPVKECPASGGGGESLQIASASRGCSLSGLEPGLWNVYARSDYLDPSESDWNRFTDDYFVIPETPSLHVTVGSDGLVRFSGDSERRTEVTVQTSDGAAICSDRTHGARTWACTTTQAPGTVSYVATAQTVGWELDTSLLYAPEEYGRSLQGISARSATIAATVATPAAPPSSDERTLTPPQFRFTGPNGTEYRPGDTVHFEGEGVPSGATVTAELHSTPVDIGSGLADTAGVFSFDGVIPADTEPGDHSFVLRVEAPGSEPVTSAQPVTISPVSETDPVVDPSDGEGEDGGSNGESVGPAGPAAPSVNRTLPNAPSALTDSVATVQDVIDRPVVLLAASGLGIALLFLVAIPTELLNGVLSSNSGGLGRGFAAVTAAADRARDRFVALVRSRAAAAGILTLVVSIIFGFTDPEFGVDIVSLRMVLSLGIALFVLTYGVAWVTGLIARRAWGAETRIEIQPAIVLFALLGVILARLLDFTPGFLLGLVIGLELVRATRAAKLGSSLLTFGAVLLLVAASWIGMSVLGALDPQDFGGLLALDTFAAVVSEGLTGASVAILPLAFLEGRELFLENKGLWVATFLVVETAFALLVLPTALEGTSASDMGTWLIVMLVFAAVTLAAWGYFVWRARRSGGQHEVAEHVASRDD